MNELRWSTGEVCRVGDVARSGYRDDGPRLVCTAVAREVIICAWEDGSADEDIMSHGEMVLLHRAGEAEDRDREKYRYHEGEPTYCGTNRQDDGWSLCGKTDDWYVFRRIRAPKPQPGPEHVDNSQKPPRLMKANDLASPPHNVEHYERNSCKGLCHAPACEPVAVKPMVRYAQVTLRKCDVACIHRAECLPEGPMCVHPVFDTGRRITEDNQKTPFPEWCPLAAVPEASKPTAKVPEAAVPEAPKPTAGERHIHIILHKCSKVCIYRTGYYLDDIWRSQCEHPKFELCRDITKDDRKTPFPEWCPLCCRSGEQ